MCSKFLTTCLQYEKSLMNQFSTIFKGNMKKSILTMPNFNIFNKFITQAIECEKKGFKNQQRKMALMEQYTSNGYIYKIMQFKLIQLDSSHCYKKIIIGMAMAQLGTVSLQKTILTLN